MGYNFSSTIMKLCGCLIHKPGLLCVKFRVNTMKTAPCRKNKVGKVFLGHPVWSNAGVAILLE